MKCKGNEDIFMIEDASFHEGIIGLVAGSICASFNKPCIVLAKMSRGIRQVCEVQRALTVWIFR